MNGPIFPIFGRLPRRHNPASSGGVLAAGWLAPVPSLGLIEALDRNMTAFARFAGLVALILSLATAAMGLASPAAAQMAGYGNGGTNPDYVLGTGDKIRVIVFGEDDLGGEVQIDGSGYFSLPLIGPVQAAGSTAPQLEQAIGTKLADGYLQNPRVSVEISTYRPFYVVGEVNRPGEYSYVNGMSALNAVALAGGFTTHADESTIYVRRNGSTKEAELPADQMTRILPGDIIRVTPSTFWAVATVVGPISGVLGTVAGIPGSSGWRP
jgi:protein involved in polysaccharide export with SLBB domain